MKNEKQGRKAQLGVTLVELLIAMVVIAVAIVGLFSAQAFMSAHNADPMQSAQAVAVAEAYLDEALLRDYGTLAACPAVPVPGGRGAFTHVCHYNALGPEVPTDQTGVSWGGLGNYRVQVAVAQSTALAGLPQADVLRVDVTVTDPQGFAYRLSGYRSNY